MLRPGHTVASERFRVVRPLAHGGSADVYLGEEVATAQPVAIKAVQLENERAASRFEREAWTLQRLNHPNVVRLYDVELRPQLGLLVMEYAAGGSPSDWVSRHGPMPPGLALCVIRQVCEGLAAAHELGIIHRDIKPQNILCRADASCMLADFGVVRFQEDGRNLTRTNTQVGTYNYMAPEQQGKLGPPTRQSDIYSLGATLHLLLTDRQQPHLFLWETAPLVLGEIPAPLLPVLQRSLYQDPSRRFGSVEEFSGALREAFDVLPAVPLDTPPFPYLHTSTRPFDPTTASGLTVLVIDDDEMLLRVAELILGANGYFVLTAQDGRGALAAIESRGREVHLILTDVVMPGETGPELVPVLRRVLPGAQVAYMSAHGREGVLDAGLPLDAAFLQKPFLPETLVQFVRAQTTADTVTDL